MKKVVAERKDIAFFIKLDPLPMHKGSYEISTTIACGGFALSLLDDAIDKKPLPEVIKCKTTAIDDDIKLAEKLGITGTPALIFPDGSLVPGALQADAIIKMVDKK